MPERPVCMQHVQDVAVCAVDVRGTTTAAVRVRSIEISALVSPSTLQRGVTAFETAVAIAHLISSLGLNTSKLDQERA